MKKYAMIVVLFSVTVAFAEPVNVNTADVATLQKVKGIGKKLAPRIVEYREKNGPFKSLDELIKVKGIGSETLAKMKPFLTVAAAVPDSEKKKKIDLNTATAKELQSISGIGKVFAERIIAYRTANGVYRSLKDLEAVDGISDTMITSWSDRLTISDDLPPKPAPKLKIYRPIH